jgi:hypothetical protein
LGWSSWWRRPRLLRILHQVSKSKREVVMSEKIKLEAISRRRVLSVFGLAAAASLAVPATVLTTTEAEAVVGRPLTPMSAAGVARRTARRNYKKKKK